MRETCFVPGSAGSILGRARDPLPEQITHQERSLFVVMVGKAQAMLPSAKAPRAKAKEFCDFGEFPFIYHGLWTR